MDEFREYMAGDMQDKINRFYQDHTLFLSLHSQGRIDAIDLHILLSTYRQLVELNYALDICTSGIFGDDYPEEALPMTKNWLSDLESVLMSALDLASAIPDELGNDSNSEDVD